MENIRDKMGKGLKIGFALFLCGSFFLGGGYTICFTADHGVEIKPIHQKHCSENGHAHQLPGSGSTNSLRVAEIDCEPCSDVLVSEYQGLINEIPANPALGIHLDLSRIKFNFNQQDGLRCSVIAHLNNVPFSPVVTSILRI